MRKGSRVSANSCLLFSSTHITGCSLRWPKAYNSKRSYMRRRYSAVILPMHHIFLSQGLHSFFLESASRSLDSRCLIPVFDAPPGSKASKSSALALPEDRYRPKPQSRLVAAFDISSDAQGAACRKAHFPVPHPDMPSLFAKWSFALLPRPAQSSRHPIHDPTPSTCWHASSPAHDALHVSVTPAQKHDPVASTAFRAFSCPIL